MKKILTCMAAALFAFANQDALYSQQTQFPGTQGPNGTRPSELPVVDNAVNSQDGQSRPGGYYPNDESPWFDNDNLRRVLELDNDQIKRLNDVYGSTWKRLRENQADARSNNNNQSNSGRDRLANSGRGLDENQRSTRLNEYRNRFDDEFNRSTSDIFRNRQQQERFNQLRLQYQGYGAFNNPALQRQMNLNDTQMRQLQELNQEWDTQMDEFRNSYAKDREGTTGRYNDFNQSARTRFEGILNDRQRQQYNEMTGDQFDFGADARLGNRNTNARANASGAIEGSGIGTLQDNGPQGSGLGTPQDNGPQGSGIGTQTDTGPQGSGLGTNTGAAGGVGTNDQNGTGTGAGAASGTGSGSGAGTGTGTGSGAESGSGSGSGGSGS